MQTEPPKKLQLKYQGNGTDGIIVVLVVGLASVSGRVMGALKEAA